jgi:hypothetical protein
LLNSGHILHAHIAYDGTNLTLVLTDTTTSASFTKTAAINIPSIVGSGTAYVGFTGGIGGLSMTTDILNWTLTSTGTQTADVTAVHDSEESPAAVEMHPVGVSGEPRFFPAAGVFARDTQVTLSSNTPGAIIHYTVDGSQPTSSSAVYGGPISVQGTELTIKAFASVAGSKDSAVVTGIYRIHK